MQGALAQCQPHGHEFLFFPCQANVPTVEILVTVHCDHCTAFVKPRRRPGVNDPYATISIGLSCYLGWHATPLITIDTGPSDPSARPEYRPQCLVRNTGPG